MADFGMAQTSTADHAIFNAIIQWHQLGLDAVNN
jgi:hypothetical protein